MIDMAGCSEKGGRNHNEDTVLVKNMGYRQCALVADGLGGHGGGDIASQTAANIIMEGFESEEAMDTDALIRIFEEANRAVVKKQTMTCRMKTTCVGLFIEEAKAWWGHIGDSRLYHFVDGALNSCTKDHSVSQMAVDAGKITWEQIRFHKERNKLYCALGSRIPIRPEVGQADLDDGHFHAFLLCTDGFWEYVLETEMMVDLAKSRRPVEWLDYMVSRLEKKVTGYHDNYTAAAVFYR